MSAEGVILLSVETETSPSLAGEATESAFDTMRLQLRGAFTFHLRNGSNQPLIESTMQIGVSFTLLCTEPMVWETEWRLEGLQILDCFTPNATHPKLISMVSLAFRPPCHPLMPQFTCAPIRPSVHERPMIFHFSLLWSRPGKGQDARILVYGERVRG